jgi:hypothetical protein
MSAGRCLCGAVSYRFDAQPEAVVLCHCEDCQRHTGSAFSMNVSVSRDRTGLNPSVEVWCRREQDWIEPNPNRLRFAGDAR